MRADSVGLWWEDLPKKSATGKRGPRQWGPMPSVPVTGWVAPLEFPNLDAAKIIGLDTETFDPELTTEGPGWGRGKGHIVGISLAVEDGSSWYFPMRHETHGEQNMDPNQVLRYMRHTLSRPVPKAGANLIYDVGWLAEEGVEVRGELFDTQFAEALLNSETPDVSLDSLAEQYLGIGKVTAELYEWLASWNGLALNDKQRKWIYKAPPSLAGPYAEADAALPIAILAKQWPLLSERGLLPLFFMECKLIRILIAMRMKGAPVKLSKAEETYDVLGHKLADIEERIKHIAGQPVNPNASTSIAAAFRRMEIPPPTMLDKKTGEIKTSFSAPLLELIEHPLPDAILEYRRIAKVRNTFVKSYIIDKHVNERVHCSFHPLKGDKGGTRSGRLSSSDPNLQNIPIRTEIGKLVREMFVASQGTRWRSLDYKSIEYRLLAHFATGEGADAVRAVFAADPDADYHAIVGDLIFRLTGLTLERAKIKNINFGIIYGMALPALAKQLNLNQKDAGALMKDYHRAAPYARATMDMCANEVHTNGFVTTVMGRRSDFPYWGPKQYSSGKRQEGIEYAAACRKWGVYNIERQNTHKALNRKLQGSAADMMKKAMVVAYEAGLFADDACGMPILTVHDELDFEDAGDPNNPAWEELINVMENCMPGLRVPIRVDAGQGPSWGSAH